MSEEVLSVRQMGRELEWVVVFEASKDIHSGRAEERPLKTLSSGGSLYLTAEEKQEKCYH